jgi:hypothetical protein
MTGFIVQRSGAEPFFTLLVWWSRRRRRGQCGLCYGLLIPVRPHLFCYLLGPMQAQFKLSYVSACGSDSPGLLTEHPAQRADAFDGWGRAPRWQAGRHRTVAADRRHLVGGARHKPLLQLRDRGRWSLEATGRSCWRLESLAQSNPGWK